MALMTGRRSVIRRTMPMPTPVRCRPIVISFH
jgi:hypothetical protein